MPAGRRNRTRAARWDLPAKYVPERERKRERERERERQSLPHTHTRAHTQSTLVGGQLIKGITPPSVFASAVNAIHQPFLFRPDPRVAGSLPSPPLTYPRQINVSRIAESPTKITEHWRSPRNRRVWWKDQGLRLVCTLVKRSTSILMG